MYGEARPQKGNSFQDQVYERVGVSLVEVYERGGKSITSEVPQG